MSSLTTARFNLHTHRTRASSTIPRNNKQSTHSIPKYHQPPSSTTTTTTNCNTLQLHVSKRYSKYSDNTVRYRSSGDIASQLSGKTNRSTCTKISTTPSTKTWQDGLHHNDSTHINSQHGAIPAYTINQRRRLRR